jgi:hypothetical protein
LAAKKKAETAASLKKQLAKKLKLTEKEVELRALTELAASLPAAASASAAAKKEPAPAPKKERPPEPRGASNLPQRLYVALEGRGLEGRGMPVEVIDLPFYVGSLKSKNNVWINSPQIETRHLMITHGDEGWLLEDLGTEHGTFLGDKRIQRRVLRNGDEFHLAGYLRLRAELK